MTYDAPIYGPVFALDPGWIDYNGHLNMAYYNVLFDRTADAAFDLIGCGEAYRRTRNMSVYTAELHVCYLRELHAGASVRGSFHLLDHDAKRLRVFQELFHADGWIAATSEVLYLHVDMDGPRVAPFPDDVMERIGAMQAAHDMLVVPERAGRSVSIRNGKRSAAF